MSDQLHAASFELSVEELMWVPLYVDQDVYAIDRGFSWQPRRSGRP